MAPFTGCSGEAFVRLHSPYLGAADVNGPAHQLTRQLPPVVPFADAPSPNHVARRLIAAVRRAGSGRH